jgi:hypothetical protein
MQLGNFHLRPVHKAENNQEKSVFFEITCLLGYGQRQRSRTQKAWGNVTAALGRFPYVFEQRQTQGQSVVSFWGRVGHML